MGRLIDQDRRRRARGLRAERKRQVLVAAREALGRLPWEDVSLEYLDRKAGVPQGTSALHFGSREDLFLAVARLELEAWYDGLERTVEAWERPVEPADVAARLSRWLRDHPRISRILALMPLAVERLTDQSGMVDLAAWQEERRSVTGAAVERACPWLVGRGDRVVRLLELLTAGAFGALFAGGPSLIVRSQGHGGDAAIVTALIEELLRDAVARTDG